MIKFNPGKIQIVYEQEHKVRYYLKMLFALRNPAQKLSDGQRVFYAYCFKNRNQQQLNDIAFVANSNFQISKLMV